MDKTPRPVPEGIASLPTTSAKVRALDGEGWSVTDIARALGIRYQHAYGVLRTDRKPKAAKAPGAKAPRPVPEEVASLKSKAGRIRALEAEGWPTAEIARALGISYSHAYSVTKGNRKRKGAPAAAAAPDTNDGPPPAESPPKPATGEGAAGGAVHATTAPREDLESRGTDDPSRIWDLGLGPDVKALDPDLRRYIEVCAEKLGLVPNVIMANSIGSGRLRTFVDSYNRLMLDEGRLSKGEREMIAVAVSSVNRCFYCLVAHGAALREISGDPGLAEAVAFNHRAASLSPRHRAMLDFATKLTESPSKMDREDQDGLRRAGFDDLAILEIAEVAGFFNMSNRIAAATGMMPNPEYHAVAR